MGCLGSRVVLRNQGFASAGAIVGHFKQVSKPDVFHLRNVVRGR